MPSPREADDAQPKNCPYCKTPVEPTDQKRYVNGIKPAAELRGCEFCNPTR